MPTSYTQQRILQKAERARRAENRKTRQNLISGNEGKGPLAAGAIATLFGVMDQPKSAIVGALTGALSDKTDEDTTNDDVVGNFIKGLTGKQHYTTADLLKQQGVDNGVVRGILGFAGDVALDPLTYVGVGRTKGMSAGTAELLAGQQLAKEGLEHGIGEAITRQALQDRAGRIMAGDPTTWDLKFGLPGHRKIISRNEPGFIRSVMEPVLGPEADRRTVARGFSRQAEQPFGMDILSRDTEAQYAGIFQEQYEGLKSLYTKIPEEDNRWAALRYENPDKYIDKPLTIDAKHRQLFDELNLHTTDDLITFTRGLNKKLKRAEMEMGAHPDLLQTKKHFIRKGGRTDVEDRQVAWDDMLDPDKGFGPEVGRAMQDQILADSETTLRKVVQKPELLELVPGLTRSRLKPGQAPDIQGKSFEELMTTRAEPIIHIGESTLQRLASSYRRQTRAAFVEEALKKFGVNAADYDDAAEIMQHLEFADLDNKLRFRPVQPGDGPRLIDNSVAGLDKYKDYYLPDDIARVLNDSERALTDPTVGAQLLQKYDRVMSHWKAFNSLLSPGYFARTTVGDVLQNTVAGVRDPRRYAEARQIVTELQQSRLKDIMGTLRNPDLPLTALSDPDKVSNFSVRLGGRDWGSHEVNRHFVDSGAMSGQIVSEQIPGAAATELTGRAGNLPTQMLRGLKGGAERGGSALNRLEAWAGDRNVGRETRLRMTNFINKMDDEITQRLMNASKEGRFGTSDLGAIRERLGPEAVAKLEKEAADVSAKHVRKYNIDYGALTTFERDVMRRVVPFYSWYRRNFPQQMMQVLSNPGFMNLYPKSVTAMQNIMGTDDPSDDWMVPDWIRESLPMRIAQAGAHGNFLQSAARFGSGAKDEEAVFMPLLQGLTPLGDLETTLQPLQRAHDVAQEGGYSPGALWAGARAGTQNAVNMSTPAIRAPFEMALGKSAYNNQEIKNWNDWLIGQSFGGPGRQLSRATGVSDQPIAPGLVSYLTGIQLQAVTQKRQRSEYQRRKDILDRRVTDLKEAVLASRGLKKETSPRAWEKATTPEIRELKRYIKYAGKSLGYE